MARPARPHDGGRHFDCRTGGSYRYVHRRDGEEYGFHGCFHEVRPNELIVQTFTFEGMPDGVALEKLVFEDLGDGRTRLVATSLVDSFEDRDAFVASGMETGVVEGYERLDELLAKSGRLTLHQLGRCGAVPLGEAGAGDAERAHRSHQGGHVRRLHVGVHRLLAGPLLG